MSEVTEDDFLKQLEDNAYMRVMRILAQANVTLSVYQYKSLKGILHDLMNQTVRITDQARQAWKPE